MSLTSKQREALAWLVFDSETPYTIHSRVWNNLEAKGLAKQWRGRLIATQEGKRVARENRSKDVR